jgi:hypothetical protein
VIGFLIDAAFFGPKEARNGLFESVMCNPMR